MLCAQLDIPYERVPVDIFAGGTLTDEFGSINPARTTPVLEVAPGTFLAESNAILVYLACGSDLLPHDRLERAQVLRWLLFEQSEVVPTIGSARFWRATGRDRGRSGELDRRLAGGRDVLRLLDEHFAGAGFAVGDRYSVADIALFAYVHVADEAGLDLTAHRAVCAWLERVRAQPGHRNDLEPYPENARQGAGRSIYG